jgi:hypothetical protein
LSLLPFSYSKSSTAPPKDQPTLSLYSDKDSGGTVLFLTVTFNGPLIQNPMTVLVANEPDRVVDGIFEYYGVLANKFLQAVWERVRANDDESIFIEDLTLALQSEDPRRKFEVALVSWGHSMDITSEQQRLDRLTAALTHKEESVPISF